MQSEICSEMNTALITNKRLLKRKEVVRSSCFLGKLLPFILKIYNLTCGLLFLLSYWESTDGHSQTYNG